MFKNPFSFEGRIRRTEYGVSTIIYIVIIAILNSIVFLLEDNSSIFAFFLILIPLFWFITAQGAKRCHDRSNSGWYQIIPFYTLWMLFADSDHGMNAYGPNPKGIGNQEQSISY